MIRARIEAASAIASNSVSIGPLPLVRQMLGLTLLSLVVFLGVGISPEITVVNMNNLDLTGYQSS